MFWQKIFHQLHLWLIPHEDNNYQPRAVRHKCLAFYSALLIGVKIFILLILFLTYPNPAQFSTITTNRIIELTNKERTNMGLSTLQHNETLDLAAQKKAADMLQNNYFAHNSPSGINPWYWFNEVGYNYTYAGENLAMNFVEAEDAVHAWMASPSHRDNILSVNYADIGIAVVVGKLDGQETTLVVQLFGKTHLGVAGEKFNPTSAPIETEQVTGPISVTEQAAQQEVKLEAKNKSGLIARILNYSEKFFLILLGFIILNLILTIIIRIEIQHKPIIMHCLWVILLALTMFFLKMHFIENLGSVVNII